VPCAPVVQKSAESAGVVIRQHKIIYKFLEDLENFVHDAKNEILESQGKALVEVIGSAKV
jgi:translation initiation factor IF-2